MIQIIYRLSAIFYIFTTTKSSGLCGDVMQPTKASDCVFASNSSYLCCFLNATNAPSLYTNCIAMGVNDITPMITIGNMVYIIDCHGIKNYKTYFPLEDEYNACGTANPVTASDCWKYNTLNNTCCIAGIDQNFSTNPTCYFYPPNINFAVQNYTTANSAKVSIYFGCGSSYIITHFYLIIIIFILYEIF